MCQSVTFRLADAVPPSVLEAWRVQLANIDDEQQSRLLRQRIDHYEDAGYGSCLLRDPRHAAIVAGELTAGDGLDYRLHAWVVMPNHVHILVGPAGDADRIDLSALTRRWKGRAARQINQACGRRGALWQRESWDRWIRDMEHFAAVRRYIERNPERAGLCGWRWVSQAVA